MIRALPLLLLALLTACAQFPQVDAATPANIPPRPNFLSPSALAAVNARTALAETGTDTAQGDTLRARAKALRARTP